MRMVGRRTRPDALEFLYADVNLLHADVVAEMGRAMKRHDERVRF
jgi:hypothetical protein